MKQVYSVEELLIKAKGVNLKFGDKQILRDVNFEVRNIKRPDVDQGQVVAMIGRSGLGKTQMFRIISGLMAPTTGSVLIDTDQHPVTAGEVGIIPQNYVLFQHHNVYQNLKLGIKNCCGKRLPAKEEDETIRKYAEDFELTDHLMKYPAQLSGGQKQRVSIIQQVLTKNKFILLDEPFSGLDSLMIDKVIKLLIRVSTLSEYATLVIVSHDIVSSMAISDMVWLLAREEGKEGATIIHTYDLKEMGLAWDPDIRKKVEFQELVADVKTKL